MELTGKAEQTAGIFSLHDNSTVKVTSFERVLGIREGKIRGHGTVDGHLVLGYDPGGPESFPSISPGIDGVNNGIGTLTITQVFHIIRDTAGAFINIDAAGNIDKIVVQGNAVLAGTLHIDHNPMYTPPAGTSKVFMTYASLVSDFKLAVTNGQWTDPNDNTKTLQWGRDPLTTQYVLTAIDGGTVGGGGGSLAFPLDEY